MSALTDRDLLTTSVAMVAVAVQALRDFDVQTRTQAVRALAAWPHVAALSERERQEVLSRFDAEDWPARLCRAPDSTAIARRVARLLEVGTDVR